MKRSIFLTLILFNFTSCGPKPNNDVAILSGDSVYNSLENGFYKDNFSNVSGELKLSRGNTEAFYPLDMKYVIVEKRDSYFYFIFADVPISCEMNFIKNGNKLANNSIDGGFVLVIEVEPNLSLNSSRLEGSIDMSYKLKFSLEEDDEGKEGKGKKKKKDKQVTIAGNPQVKGSKLELLEINSYVDSIVEGKLNFNYEDNKTDTSFTGMFEATVCE